jgi:hypothetical protein
MQLLFKSWESVSRHSGILLRSATIYPIRDKTTHIHLLLAYFRLHLFMFAWSDREASLIFRLPISIIFTILLSQPLLPPRTLTTFDNCCGSTAGKGGVVDTLCCGVAVGHAYRCLYVLWCPVTRQLTRSLFSESPLPRWIFHTLSLWSSVAEWPPVDGCWRLFAAMSARASCWYIQQGWAVINIRI